MRQTGADFVEETVSVHTLPGQFALAERSPSRMVPVLHHGDLVVWDSLAIVEYLAELFPDAGLWPSAPGDRARARSACAEMHSGFPGLRAGLPMDIRKSGPPQQLDKAMRTELRRLLALWGELRERAGPNNPFLFGAWCAADAFFAPMATRFRSYAIALSDAGQAYVDSVLAWPPVMEWCEAARAETGTTDAVERTK